jgi:hypothetical protein
MTMASLGVIWLTILPAATIAELLILKKLRTSNQPRARESNKSESAKEPLMSFCQMFLPIPTKWVVAIAMSADPRRDPDG